MQLNEICKQTGLTKKAVEYYQLKGLVSPKVNENGYREFSDSDLSRLKEIALFRKLELCTDEIKQVLDSNDKKHTLALIKQAKEIQAKAKLYRLDLIGQLINGVDVAEIQDSLNLLEQQSTIKEKLLMAFPGYYGRYFSFHFGQFLNEPVKTNEQKVLYDNIVNFLDDMEPIEIPEEFQSILDEADKYMDNEKIEEMSANIQSTYDDFDTYWENNKDNIIQYTEFKKTDKYQNSVMAQLMDLFRKFGETNGYYDVFIPMMRTLSPAYDFYYKKMLEANEKLIQKIPDVENWYEPTK
ncbi:MAG: MerR family transcriptional regulator [Dehalobacter sp. 4CP]|uniref:MerR family transcriptional regulator n=1 Tax=Dehalobacter sp. CP TaxID=2594474 RepID=UPI0013C98279|nr:MerR family transcriptional regulator [Dehalobacter sp. 4CP]